MSTLNIYPISCTYPIQYILDTHDMYLHAYSVFKYMLFFVKHQALLLINFDLLIPETNSLVASKVVFSLNNFA